MRNPLITREDITKTFGELPYSLQVVEETEYFHTIILNEYSIYIEEWLDEEGEEYITNIFDEKKQAYHFVSNTKQSILSRIKDFLKDKF